MEIHTRSTIKLWNSTKVLVEFQSCGVEIHAVDLHMYSTYELVDLQFSCGIGVEHWISTCGLCNQGLEPHLESGAPHSPFVTPSPLVHFFFYRTSTALSTFVGVPLLQQNVRGVTLGGGLPPRCYVAAERAWYCTYGGMPPSAALQQSGSVQLGTPSKRTGTYISILIRLHFAM